MDLRSVRTSEDYLDLYEAAGQARFRGEASTSYLPVQGTAERIHDFAPDARIVVSLRDPVKRAWSHYLMNWRRGVDRRPFAEAVKDDLDRDFENPQFHFRYVKHGLYHRQLRSYLDLFGEDQVHVLSLEEIAQDPVRTVDRILAFLGLEEAGSELTIGDRHNAYRAPRNRITHRLRTHPVTRWVGRTLLPPGLRQFLKHRVLAKPDTKPELPEHIRRTLEKKFEPDLRKTEKILPRDLPGLWNSWSHAQDAKRGNAKE